MQPVTARERLTRLLRPAFRRALWLWGRLPLPNSLRWAMVWVVSRKFLVGVSAVVFDAEGRVLLLRHTYRPKIPWGLPSGWLEKDEAADRAIEREIAEETGLVVRVTGPLYIASGGNISRIDLVYLACLESGTFRPSAEVSEARFFAIDDLPRLMTEQRELIEMGARRQA